MAQEKFVPSGSNYRHTIRGYYANRSAEIQIEELLFPQTDLKTAHRNIDKIEQVKLEKQRRFHKNRGN